MTCREPRKCPARNGERKDKEITENEAGHPKDPKTTGSKAKHRQGLRQKVRKGRARPSETETERARTGQAGRQGEQDFPTDAPVERRRQDPGEGKNRRKRDGETRWRFTFSYLPQWNH